MARAGGKIGEHKQRNEGVQGPDELPAGTVKHPNRQHDQMPKGHDPREIDEALGSPTDGKR